MKFLLAVDEEAKLKGKSVDFDIAIGFYEDGWRDLKSTKELAKLVVEEAGVKSSVSGILYKN